MKERPILFSTPMVRAILNGNKTQTRRTKGLENLLDCSSNHKLYNAEWKDDPMKIVSSISDNLNHYYCQLCGNGIGSDGNSYIKCPYGKPGDILIVKELHWKFGHWERDGFTDKGSEKWKFVPDSNEVYYYDNPPEVFYKSRRKKHSLVPSWYKRNSLFMEKEDARLHLRITEVGVERLNDISEEDALKEGVLRLSDAGGSNYKFFWDYMEGNIILPTKPVSMNNAYNSFKSLWESINGSGSWEENPYVWVIKFEKI